MFQHFNLSTFPLFQGMSNADLMEVIGHTKLGFSKLPAGKQLVEDGDACTHLIFLTHGTLLCKTVSDDHACRVDETIHAPYTIQPEHLFGLTQHYTSSFTAATPCSIITISKQEVLLLLETQLVFRLNMLNILSADIHRYQRRTWRSAPHSLQERLIRFFLSHSQYPAGPKTIYVLMQYLADQLNDSRLDISHALHDMQHSQLLTLHRGRIEIPMLERLLM